MYGALQPLGIARRADAHHGAGAMARGIVGWQRRVRHQNHRDVLQPAVLLDDGAQLAARDASSLRFRKQHVRSVVFEDSERLLRSGYNNHLIAVLLQQIAHRARRRGIRFDSKDANVARAGLRRRNAWRDGVGPLELNRDGVVEGRLRLISDHSRAPRHIDRSGHRLVRKRDVQNLADPVAAARSPDQQAVARHVDAARHVLEEIESSHATANVYGLFKLDPPAAAPVRRGSGGMPGRSLAARQRAQ